MRSRGEKIAVITAYDYSSARIVDGAGIPVILVGDSLGQVVLGYDSTLPVTMDEMVHHVRAVVRGSQRAHIVADMPFMSYQADVAEALGNAGRLLKEGGAQSVKLEGGRQVAETVKRIVQAGIPVMGHIGLTPQSVNQLGGYRVQGKSAKAAIDLMEDARVLAEAGAYAVVLELVPAPLAALITERLSVPTIGIGAGPGLRRSGPGLPRSAGPAPRLRAQARSPLCQPRGNHRQCRGRVRQGGTGTVLPIGAGELLDEAERAGGAHGPACPRGLSCSEMSDMPKMPK